MMLLEDTVTSPNAMTMLLQMLASSEVLRTLNNSQWCWSQNCELTQRKLLNDSVAAAHSVGLCKQY